LGVTEWVYVFKQSEELERQDLPKGEKGLMIVVPDRELGQF
jgi:hypothetical protein